MPGDCLFCRIVAGEIPSTRVSEDADTVAFRDVNPQASTHVLVVPRRHIGSVDALEASDAELAGRVLLAAQRVAREAGLRGGYRLVVNTGPDAGQTVDHLHVHVLGGRALTWPPG